jgi:hypothetical protein
LTTPLATPLAIACVLAAGAGCAGQAPAGAGPTSNGSPPVTAGATPATTNPPAGSTTAAPPAWPSPADCVSYNPNALTVHYEAGVYTVTEGSTVVVRLHGEPGSNVGQKGLALAQHYRRHCFIGRTNNREEPHVYIFDYWRDLSGLTPAIPDQEDDCSDYNRNNLTVEDMGGGDGWRVKDHDHILGLFDNESDARNGKLVLSKYHQICTIGDSDDVDPDVVTYFR